jgi:hypothetical protein
VSAHVVAAGGGRPAVECPLSPMRESLADTDRAPVEIPSLGVNQGRAPPAALL